MSSEKKAPEDTNISTSSPLDYDLPASDTRASSSTRRSMSQQTGLDGSQGQFREVRLSERETVIWGTNISVRETKDKLSLFLNEFVLDDSGMVYRNRLEKKLLGGEFVLTIDLADLRAFDGALFEQTRNFPQEMLKVMDSVLSAESAKIRAEKPMWPLPESIYVQTRVFDSAEEAAVSMRLLDPSHIDTLVTIRGLITRCGRVSPDLQKAFYVCEKCGEEVEVDVDFNSVVEPAECPNESCRQRRTLKLLHTRSAFANKQLVRLQESPENVPRGETPMAVDVIAFDSLIDAVRPGDRVEVSGVYRVTGVRKSLARREVKSIYKTYIDAVHFRARDGGGAGTGSRVETGDSDEAKFKELAAREDVYEVLTRSLAPSIFGMDDVKKGVLCLLFGGSEAAGCRREVNILLFGDPGTSKSQLLQFVHRVAPRGIYTSGKGSSAVGLTAYVSKDPETREVVLESGALVLSDRGVCCIDEFDKMSESSRAILHEVMEQQTVSLAKAGVICSLNARTSVLAAANPKESRYNKELSVVKNLQLPATLVSRFDLIYLVLDKAHEQKDALLAEHIVSLYSPSASPLASPLGHSHGRGTAPHPLTISVQELTAYVKYAKQKCNPRISKEAREQLVEGYLALRTLGNTYNKNVITATPRQLESMIRLSEALAKMRLDDLVRPRDVEEAIRLIRQSTHSAATDPRTGLIDLDLIITGKGTLEREADEEKNRALLEAIGELKQRKKKTTLEELLAYLSNNKKVVFTHTDLAHLLKNLEDEDVVRITSKHGATPTVNFL